MRDLKPHERAVLEEMLCMDFAGREQLEQQLRGLLVEELDRNGSLALRPVGDVKAVVSKRIPVEGETSDVDGVRIHVLLHVCSGELNELEVFREDGGAVQTRPIRADALHVSAW